MTNTTKAQLETQIADLIEANAELSDTINAVESERDSAIEAAKEVTVAQALGNALYEKGMVWNAADRQMEQGNIMGMQHRFILDGLLNTIHRQINKAREYAVADKRKVQQIYNDGGFATGSQNEQDVIQLERAVERSETGITRGLIMTQLKEQLTDAYKELTGEVWTPYDPDANRQPTAKTAEVGELLGKMKAMGLEVQSELETNTDGVETQDEKEEVRFT